ncbi:hypothetical protein BVRB_5g122540 [Beta vulgaris subsp. vulgaris]|nr:hypothetical protein BVRB_5g122540 [Beta vulgaris subsp. vulgaris]
MRFSSSASIKHHGCHEDDIPTINTETFVDDDHHNEGTRSSCSPLLLLVIKFG